MWKLNILDISQIWFLSFETNSGKRELVIKNSLFFPTECKYQDGICPRWYLSRTSNNQIATNVRAANEPSSVLNI